MTPAFWATTLFYAVSSSALLLPAIHSRRWTIRLGVLWLTLGALLLLWLASERTLFWIVPVSLALTAALSFATLRLRHRRSRLGAALVMMLALAGVWALGRTLEQREWRNVGGYVDCWPSCDRWQLLGGALHWVPATVGIAVVLIVVASDIVGRASVQRGHAPSIG
jgi:hypothetical protein